MKRILSALFEGLSIIGFVLMGCSNNIPTALFSIMLFSLSMVLWKKFEDGY